MAETGTQNITEVTEASSIATGDNIYLNHSNQLQQIDYDKLATAILNKLSTQSFSSLETTAKTVLGGINELNSKIEIGIISSNSSKTFIANQCYVLCFSVENNYAIYGFRENVVCKFIESGEWISASLSGKSYTIENASNDNGVRYLAIKS